MKAKKILAFLISAVMAAQSIPVYTSAADEKIVENKSTEPTAKNDLLTESIIYNENEFLTDDTITEEEELPTKSGSEIPEEAPALYANASIVAGGYCGSEGDGTNLTWELDSNGTLTISGTGSMKNYTGKDSPWYVHYNSIERVIISNGATTIGNYAFYGLDGINRVPCDTLPSSLIQIGASAFESGPAFSNGLIIPEGVTTIQSNAFASNSGIHTVSIPATVTSIGTAAFLTRSLTAINVDINNTKYSSDGGVLFNKTKTTLLQYPLSNTREEYSIPSTVTKISQRAFFNNILPSRPAIKRIVFSENLKEIGEWAFAFTNLTGSITFPAGVNEIGVSSFYNCTNISSAYFEGNAPSIIMSSFVGNMPFDYCADDFTIYYNDSATGWTDSDVYNVEKGTWNGYKLEVWEDDSDDEPSTITTYTRFGQYNGCTTASTIDPVTGLRLKRAETATIDGVTYPVSDSFDNSANILDIAFPGNWLDNYYYIAYSFNDANEIVSASVMSGEVCKLEGWDSANSVIETDIIGRHISVTNPLLDLGEFKVSDTVKNTFPYDRISSWVGDDIRVYTYGETIYKIIHITYGSGTITAFDPLSTPQKVYIDNVAYSLASGNDELVQDIQYTQFERALYTTYDSTIVDLISYKDAINGAVAYLEKSHLLYGKDNNDIITHKTQRIILNIRNNVLFNNAEYLDILQATDEFYVDILSVDLQLNTSSPIKFDDGSYNINFSPDNTDIFSNIHTDLEIGESCEEMYCLELSLDSGYSSATTTMRCTVEATVNHQPVTHRDEIEITIDGLGTYCPPPPVQPKPTPEDDTEEPSHDSFMNIIEKLRETAKENLRNSLDLDSTISIPALLPIVGKENYETIRYIILTSVLLYSYPTKDYKDVIKDKVLDDLFGEGWDGFLTIRPLDMMISITVNTPKYGELIFEFTITGSIYALDGVDYGRLASINYKIIGGSGTVKTKQLLKHNGTGIISSADIKAFTEATQNAAMTILENAYDWFYGKHLDEVCKYLFSDTVSTILEILDTSYSGIFWSVFTEPSKQIRVNCPVDIYVYDNNSKLCASIVNNIATSPIEGNLSVYTSGETKCIDIYGGAEYTIKYVASDNGTMDITVIEKVNSEDISRVIEFDALPLIKKTTYDGAVTADYLADNNFSLTQDTDYIIPDKNDIYMYTHICAEIIEDSGTCGDTATWTLTKDGTLTISGTGAVYDYNRTSPAPWYTYRNVIKQVIVEESVERLGAYAFLDLINVKNIQLAEGLLGFGDCAFHNCRSLEVVNLPASLDFGAGLVNAFHGCTSLENVYIPSSNEFYESRDGVIISKYGGSIVVYPAGKTETSYAIPSGITSISGWAFTDCTSLEQVIIPESVTEIYIWAFSDCTNLKSVYFKGNVPTIWRDGIFNNTSSDLTLYYPKGNTSGWDSPIWNAPDGLNYNTSTWESIGDVDGDGILTNRDVDIIKQYFAGGLTYAVLPESADADRDGKVTRRDAMILARHLAGWEGYTLPYTVSSLDVLNEIEYIRCCFSTFGGSPNGYNDSGESVNWNLQIRFSHEILHTYIDDLRNIKISTSWTDQLVSDSSWDKAKSGITQITRTQSTAYNGTQLWTINILLPDDPIIAGEQFVLLSLHDRVLKISFNLTYNGDYKTGTGWSISDVRY